LRIRRFDPIAEVSELSDHSGSAPLPRLFGDGWAPFFVTDSLVQEQPDQPTLSMRNRPDSLIMSQARDRTAIDNLEDTSFDLYGGVSSLIENAPHVAIALRGPAAVVHAPALVVAGACTNPGGETFLGRKYRCSGTDFGNDLLRRVHTQTGHLSQPLDRVLVLAEQTSHLLVQLADLLLEELQLLQHHLQEPSVHGLEVRARAERRVNTETVYSDRREAGVVMALIISKPPLRPIRPQV
jgi:hypothetical protein